MIVHMASLFKDPCSPRNLSKPKMSYPQNAYPRPMNAVAYPGMPSTEPQYEYKSQCCGVIWAILCIIGNLMTVVMGFVFVSESLQEGYFILVCYGIFSIISGSSMIYFYVRAMVDKTYTAGAPTIIKFWPLMVSMAFSVFGAILSAVFRGSNGVIDSVFNLGSAVFWTGLTYYIYGSNDDENPSCICCKPVIRVKPNMFLYGGYGYPPMYPAAAPMGYPPQQHQMGYPQMNHSQYQQSPQMNYSQYQQPPSPQIGYPQQQQTPQMGYPQQQQQTPQMSYSHPQQARIENPPSYVQVSPVQHQISPSQSTPSPSPFNQNQVHPMPPQEKSS